MQEGEKKRKNLENLGLSLKSSPENEEMSAWGYKRGPALFYLDLLSVSHGTKRKKQSRMSFERPLCYEL